MQIRTRTVLKGRTILVGACGHFYGDATMRGLAFSMEAWLYDGYIAVVHVTSVDPTNSLTRSSVSTGCASRSAFGSELMYLRTLTHSRWKRPPCGGTCISKKTKDCL